MDLKALYQFRFEGIDQGKRIAVWAPISHYLTALADHPIRVLDPACGLGEFINSCPSPERWAADLGHDGEFLDKNITFVPGSFFEIDLPDSYFDLVFVSNVLEHLKDQIHVNQFLVHARKKLRPGGFIVVIGPNFRFCSKEYFDCADHNVILTHLSVEEHLHTAGFSLVQTKSRFLPYSFRSKLPARGWTTKAYLKFPLIWRVMGKQFLLVAKRPL